MDEGSVIRLFTFHAVRSRFDEILRQEIVPDLCAKPGVLDCYSARQGPEEIGPRIVVSVWASRAAMVEAVGEEIGSGPFHPEYLSETTDRQLQVLPVEIEERFETAEPARILRILRGTVKSGEIAAYIDEVRDGVHLDASRPNGPVSLYLAPSEPERFVTVSSWCSWSDIEVATGGDVRRPQATKRPERLSEWDVNHFEIVRST